MFILHNKGNIMQEAEQKQPLILLVEQNPCAQIGTCSPLRHGSRDVR